MRKLAKILLAIMIFSALTSFAYAGPDDLPDILPQSTDPISITTTNTNN